MAARLETKEPQSHDPQAEADYDEDADSDFDSQHSNADSDVQSSGEEDTATIKAHSKPTETAKELQELDSGDEATIQEHQRKKRRKKDKYVDQEKQSDEESDGWRAKTRAMRDREKDEKRRNKLASSKTSTIDVDKIWAEMNAPGPPHPVQSSSTSQPVSIDKVETKEIPKAHSQEADKENSHLQANGEMIKIKRTYKFAGQVHVEEKLVPRTGAEARLWLAQQEANSNPVLEDDPLVQRPLRKISRFDPNFANLEAFKSTWTSAAREDPFRGPKLNTVEKSRMDWASHVDAEGLKEELDEHAKAKEGYMNRMDFLRDVEARRDEEARIARLKNR